MKNLLLTIVANFLSKFILLALIIPSYFIVVWIFPGLEYHGTLKGRAFTFIPLIYTVGLFAAVAVAAVILFTIAMILTQAIKALFSRSDA